MAEKKGGKKGEKTYSYEEYRKTFYPNPPPQNDIASQDPKLFGRQLAEDALKQVRAQLRKK
jgi:hypothetical protein